MRTKITFVLEGCELEAAEEFRRSHEGCWRQTAIGGQFSYTFSPTGVGTVVKVKCACGAFHDVTDYESW